MKLYEISFFEDEGEYDELIVCENEKEAQKRLEKRIDELTGYSFGSQVKEIAEVDGYKIQVLKN